MRSYFTAVNVLHYREWIRFLRSPGRIVGAVGAPIVFWVLLGSGMNTSFQSRALSPTGGYLEYFYPGMLAMVVLFTSIFASISLIEDRREGFLQMVLVTAVPRSAIVLGKVLGAATLATTQAILLLAILPLLGLNPSWEGVFLSFVVIFVMSLTLSALGFLCAWKFNSVQSFHSVMNLLLFPMWLLSGALFPAAGASAWISWVMAINPLTYGVLPLRNALYTGAEMQTPGESIWICLFVLAGFSVLFLGVSTFLVNRNRVASGAS